MNAVEDVLEQWLASQGLQHLRQVAVHSFSLAGGQDHDTERHGVIPFPKCGDCTHPRRDLPKPPSAARRAYWVALYSGRGRWAVASQGTPSGCRDGLVLQAFAQALDELEL